MNPKLQSIIDSIPEDLRDLYSHRDFVPFGSSSDDWIHNPGRMDRVHEAAEYGGDGSTHGEIIGDWREFADRLFSDLRGAIERNTETDEEADGLISALEKREAAIHAEIDACEAWHAEHGSLDSIIG